MKKRIVTFQQNRRIAKQLWGSISATALNCLRKLTTECLLSVGSGDLLLLDGRWYVTHTGLLGLARRNHCAGINVQAVPTFSDPSIQRWAFEATVYDPKRAEALSAMAMQIRPMSLRSSEALKCV